MERFRLRTGQRLTYDRLATLAGLSRATIEAIASRSDYNTTLSTIEKICVALDCTPGDLLEVLPNDGTTRATKPSATQPRSRNVRHGVAGRSGARR